MLSNRPSWQYIVPDKAWLKPGLHKQKIRDLLSEFDIVIPQGIHSIAKRVPDILEDAGNGLPGTMRHLLRRLNDHLKELDRSAEELEPQIRLWHKGNGASQKLETIPGIGSITASAIVATVGEAKEFKNGRQLSQPSDDRLHLKFEKMAGSHFLVPVFL